MQCIYLNLLRKNLSNDHHAIINFIIKLTLTYINLFYPNMQFFKIEESVSV